MIKDVFSLKKNNIFCKMLKWVWNVDYRDFSHMCPFFWLSVVTIILFIPSCIFFFLMNIVRWFDKKGEAYNERKRAEIRNRIAIDPGYLDVLLKKYNYNYDNIPYWLLHLFNYTLTYNKINEYKDIKRKIKEERTLTNKQRINLILKYTMPTVRVVLYIIAIPVIIFVGYTFYELVIYLLHIKFSPIDWHKILLALIGCLEVISLVLVVFLVIRLIDKFVKVPNISKPFTWFLNGIVVIWEVIIQLYHDSCPAINWED